MHVRIALDAAGGDLAPEAQVRGALQAVAARGGELEVLLVGPGPQVEAALMAAGGGIDGVRPHPSGPGVPEGGHPANWMRRHPDNSIQECARLVARGLADAAVSVGHTGACLIAATWEMGLLAGIQRPAAAVAFSFAPDMTFLDAGPNPDPSPMEMVQFARMGAAYAHAQFGIARPTVALLSNGSEPGKGNRLAQRTHELLERGGLNFVGNVEGIDLVRRPADVVVTDGFTGNAVLKAIEGLGEYVVDRLNALLPAGLAGRAEILAGMSALGDVTQSGAPVALLGTDGLFVPGHGRSPAGAIAQTLLRTETIVRNDFRQILRRALAPAVDEGANMA